ncbi:hypothetical protein [Allorhizocola rhizosphaerae]|uniref:hypothetical protein n=1 Tax=Allorhizocola rhizosphaerae TaxID=1872709 RepID=UPI000E3C57CC|nr:hypothetical protein [Allorhizocola rhizosphaerae]
MSTYTEQEIDTIRQAAFGAMTLVSAADPGFFAMFKESMAGAKALASASGELQTVFKSGGLPPMPKGGKDEMKATVLGALQQSTQIIQTKAPQDLEPFKQVIAAACDQVASASDGVKPEEQQAINEVKSAIGLL